ncbi:flavodoxin domain-containing protein [Klebsiella variicola subsp. variicola]|nr:flavodoxin domain-containing protein [Klebsiella variicola subsp. variicola]
MANIGIFFGTDTGKTRKIAKMIHKQLGRPPPPRSILTAPRWRTCWPTRPLLLGTPTLGDGQLPGLEAGGESESWAEFIRNLGDVSLQGKRWRCLASAISVAIRITSPAGCGRCTTPCVPAGRR